MKNVTRPRLCDDQDDGACSNCGSAMSFGETCSVQTTGEVLETLSNYEIESDN